MNRDPQEPHYTPGLLEHATGREQVTVLVEVDVATSRPPRVHARTWTWLTVQRRDRSNVLVDAETTAMLMAMGHPAVVMALGARVIDWA